MHYKAMETHWETIHVADGNRYMRHVLSSSVFLGELALRLAARPERA